VEIHRKLRSEFVENVRGVSSSGEEYERSSRTAPIEYLQPHVAAHCDEPPEMRRGVLPIRGLLRVERNDDRQEKHDARCSFALR
jgi:hypothetical protein